MRRVLLAVAAVLLLPALAFSASGTAAPFVKPQWFDSNGDPCNGCKMFVYDAGTSTKSTTYSDSGLSSANTNPVVLDAAGRANIFVVPGASYKFVLAPSSDSDPPTSPHWTVDNVSAVPPSSVDVDVSGTAGENISASNVVYLSAGDGGRTAGRWYKADSDLDYGSVTAQALGYATAAITSGSSGTIRVAGRVTGLAGLSAGSTYYIDATAGGVTGTPPTNARKVGVADSATSVIVSEFLSPPDASATLSGVVSTGTQSFAGNKTFTGNVDVQGDLTADVGAGTEESYMSGVIEVNTTSVGNVGAGEDDLMSYTLPANTLSRNGQVLRVRAWGILAGADADRTVKFYFGGTVIPLSFVFPSAVSTSFTSWFTETFIIRTSAGNQRIIHQVSQLYGSTNASTHQAHGSTTTMTKDETTALIIKLTGTSAGAVNDDIVQRMMIIESLN